MVAGAGGWTYGIGIMASPLRHFRARLLKLGFGAHRAIYEWSDGRIGAHLRLPMLLLTTIGRTSGLERTTPLVYLRDGDAYIVFGSDGAARNDPHWHRNLMRNPSAKIRVGRERFEVRARVAEGAERERLWAVGKTVNPMWETYQQRTTRQIPVVVLEPVARL